MPLPPSLPYRKREYNAVLYPLYVYRPIGQDKTPMPVLFHLIFRNFSLFIIPILPYSSETDPNSFCDNYFFINKNKTRPLRGLVLFAKFGFEILKNIPDFPGIILGFLWIIPISF